MGGMSGWIREWTLLSLAGVFVLARLSFVIQKSYEVQVDDLKHQLVDWLFKQPYRPRVDGIEFAGVDMKGFGRLPPLWDGLDGVQQVTKYTMLMVFSGLWLLFHLLWDAVNGASGERELWISLLSFVLYVVASYIHKLKGELRKFRKRV